MIYHYDNSDTHSPQGLKPQHSAVAFFSPPELSEVQDEHHFFDAIIRNTLILKTEV